MKILIVVYHPFELWQAPPWFAERLRADFPGLDVVQRTEYANIEDDLGEAEVAVTWSLRPEQFRAARKLRWIHSPAAAVHALMIPEIVASDVVVTNARDVHGPVVAEHAIALILALAKRLPSAFRYQQEGRWAQDQIWRESPRPREVAGATLGLVGLGSIGLETAKRAAALGMQVVAVREHADKPHDAFVTKVFAADKLDEILHVSDYVVLAAPLTPRTRALINRDRLQQMKPDAYLINVSRGALLDEAAVVEALRVRLIAGAALDVFEKEPLAAESPLWKTEHLLITPHTAALTEKLWERHYRLLCANLRRFITGEPLLNTVDKSRGY
jgi:phosphoglycerate dehydrogenase-like enzyme